MGGKGSGARPGNTNARKSGAAAAFRYARVPFGSGMVAFIGETLEETVKTQKGVVSVRDLALIQSFCRAESAILLANKFLHDANSDMRKPRGQQPKAAKGGEDTQPTNARPILTMAERLKLLADLADYQAARDKILERLGIDQGKAGATNGDASPWDEIDRANAEARQAALERAAQRPGLNGSHSDAAPQNASYATVERASDRPGRQNQSVYPL